MTLSSECLVLTNVSPDWVIKPLSALWAVQIFVLLEATQQVKKHSETLALSENMPNVGID